MRRITFVTGNAGKLAEARALLDGIAEVDQDTRGYLEIQADTLEEVVRHGLDEVGKRLDPPYILEDSGLFIDPLHGFPGVYSAYVYKTLGCHGILHLLDDHPAHERTAQFAATVGYRDSKGDDHVFDGLVTGRIARTERGSAGFGYDPIFSPDAGDGRTFAEMEPQEKGRLSHRGSAMHDLANHLKRER